MKVLGHTAISLVVGGILYNISHSVLGVFAFLTTSILIDIDHYIDYIRENGLTLNLIKVNNTYRQGLPCNFKKITLIFHSYELLAALCIIISIFDLNIVYRYAATGMMLHLFIDQMTNPVKPLTYFFMFRLFNKFTKNRIFLPQKEFFMYKDKGNRIFERIAADLAVRYSPKGSDREFCTTIKNISENGLRMTLLKKLEPGTVIDLEIFKYDKETRARCRGKIVWISNGHLSKEQNYPIEAGIQFIDRKLVSVENIVNHLKDLE
ncbi:MAG: PilZ domain-containing protein [Candidatus Omnitrophota bacterium]